MRCAVCRKPTIRGQFDICPECDWEDDLDQLANPDETGANLRTYNEYRKKYWELKSADPHFSCKNKTDKQLMLEWAVEEPRRILEADPEYQASMVSLKEMWEKAAKCETYAEPKTNQPAIENEEPKKAETEEGTTLIDEQLTREYAGMKFISADGLRNYQDTIYHTAVVKPFVALSQEEREYLEELHKRLIKQNGVLDSRHCGNWNDKDSWKVMLNFAIVTDPDYYDDSDVEPDEDSPEEEYLIAAVGYDCTVETDKGLIFDARGLCYDDVKPLFSEADFETAKKALRDFMKKAGSGTRDER